MNFHTANGDDYYDDMRRKYSAKPNTSKIPPNLSSEELEEWIQELEYQKEEKKRRSKSEFYPYGSTKLKKRQKKSKIKVKKKKYKL